MSSNISQNEEEEKTSIEPQQPLTSCCHSQYKTHRDFTDSNKCFSEAQFNSSGRRLKKQRIQQDNITEDTAH